MSEKTETIESAKAVAGKLGAGGLSLAGVAVLVIMQLLQSLSGADAARDAKLDRVFEIANTTSASVQVIENRMTTVERAMEKLTDRMEKAK